MVSVDSHTFFTYDGVIYDYIKNDDELYSELNEDVLHILYKPVSSYKDTKLAIEERIIEVNNSSVNTRKKECETLLKGLG